MPRIFRITPFLCLAMATRLTAGELPTTDPAQVGLSDAKIAAITPALQKLVDEGAIPGGVALIVRHGKVAYCAAFGYRDIERKIPMTENTIFAIASMTKPITAVAAMRLVEQGKLSLDDPVSKYIPALADLDVIGPTDADEPERFTTVAAERPVTIRHLFTHTSGFTYGPFMSDDARVARTYARAGVMSRETKTLAEQVDRLGSVVLAHQPGEEWTYGLSHDVLARVVEVVSGQTYLEYLNEHIFGPLDMRDTGFLVPESSHDRMALIYRAGGGELTPSPPSYGSDTLFGGGAGLFSTARDYARFCQMLLNGGELDGARILAPESIQQMTTDQIAPLSAFGSPYGLGFGLDYDTGPDGQPRTLKRYSWGGIFSTNFWIEPPADLAAILMTQVLPTNNGGAERVFRKAVEEAITDPN